MAAQFVGLYMRVVLREPAGFELFGVVQGVEAGSSLTLVDVFIPATNERRPRSRISAANIADLSEIIPPPAAVQQPVRAPPQPAIEPERPPAVAQPSLVDPAIMSVGRRPTSSTPKAATPTKPTGPGGDWGLLFGTTAKPPALEADIPAPIEDLNVHDGAPAENGVAADPEDVSPAKKKRPRARKSKHVQNQSVDGLEEEPSTPGGHGKGWRQTPILQSTDSFQPFNSLKRAAKGRKGRGEDNGWASEDVTEEMGEFDFENNLAKFDKRTVFDQLRQEDQVDEGDRLVSHNRKPKPGTAGGKNLHYTENVLDLPPSLPQNPDYWNSEADVGLDGAERPTMREARSTQLVRRADSKTGLSRRSQSRKASGVANAVTGGLPLSRVNSSVRHSQTSQRSTSNPDGQRSNSLQQARVSSPLPDGLYLDSSSKRLETISTLQMLNLENIAANEIGFTEELMSENAGRGIAEVSVTALSDPAMKARFELASSGPTEVSLSGSTVVVLAGNNKSSIRALAAARHLRNKNISVVVCLVGIEREKDLLEDLRRQITLYRNFGGKVFSKNDFFEHLRKGSTAGTKVTVSLIIDALLGLTISFEELRIGDQATVYELMEWANRNEAFVLAVDIPTGIDPTTGRILIIDGSKLFVKPRYIVAIGAPKKGLLEAVRPAAEGEPDSFSNPAQDEEWQLFLADLGLGSAVWRKAGTKARRGIDFEGKWVMEMRYRGVGVRSDED